MRKLVRRRGSLCGVVLRSLADLPPYNSAYWIRQRKFILHLVTHLLRPRNQINDFLAVSPTLLSLPPSIPFSFLPSFPLSAPPSFPSFLLSFHSISYPSLLPSPFSFSPSLSHNLSQLSFLPSFPSLSLFLSSICSVPMRINYIVQSLNYRQGIFFKIEMINRDTGVRSTHRCRCQQKCDFWRRCPSHAKQLPSFRLKWRRWSMQKTEFFYSNFEIKQFWSNNCKNKIGWSRCKGVGLYLEE